jgi:hypothetical protein
MVQIVADRLRETASNTGTTLELDGAVGGFRDLDTPAATNDTVDLVVYNSADNTWQAARYTFTSGSPDTIAVSQFFASSTGSAITWGAGVKDIFCGPPASVLKSLSAYGGDFTLINGTLSASVGSNALTVSVLTLAGAAPSPSDPVFVVFRPSGSSTSATPVVRIITAATTVIVSNGSTLGTSNSVPFRLWVTAHDDDGTVRLGISNRRSGLNILPYAEQTRVDTTAEGGAGGADSAGVIYSMSAVSAKAFRIAGFFEWGSGLGTAGAWSSGPTIGQMMEPGIKKPGDLVQRRGNQTGAVATGTTTVPADDTIPQNTEGDQYLTQAITPTSVANLLEIEVAGYGALSSQVTLIHSLFQDSTANALASGWASAPTGALAVMFLLGHTMLAATVSETTFNWRAGPNTAATFTFNGSGGNRFFGGAFGSRMAVREIQG